MSKKINLIHNNQISKTLVILSAFIFCIVAIFYLNRAGELYTNKLTKDESVGTCGVIAGAEMSTDSCGRTNLKITVKNISDKSINRIIMYLYPKTKTEKKSTLIFLKSMIIQLRQATLKSMYISLKTVTQRRLIYTFTTSDTKTEVSWGLRILKSKRL